MNENVSCVIDSKSGLGEGPLWSHTRERLYWVDIDAGIVHSFDPVSGNKHSIETGRRVGAVVCRAEDAGGGLVLATDAGFYLLDEICGELTFLSDPESGNEDTRFNDGKCDPAGRFWAGTMSYSRTRGSANLWCLDTDYSVTRRVSGVTVSNGITWSLDTEKMYYIDSSEFAVVAFDFIRESGEISNPRPVILVPHEIGKPDGMCIDSEGMLWIALFRGGAVSRWDPETGKLLELVEIPCKYVTSCAFGGGDMKTLYVTTARAPADGEELEKYPQSGGLFSYAAKVAGCTFFEFLGKSAPTGSMEEKP